MEDLQFIKNVIVSLARYGVQNIRGAIILGQQTNPAGLYYSGRDFQPETIFLKKLIKGGFFSYNFCFAY